MATSKRLKAWVRYDGQKKIVPSSLILQANKPKVGTWVEISADLCCGTTPCPAPNYGEWRLVTGGEAGDGVVLIDNVIDNEFTFVGPNNDDDSNGWVYLTRYFAETTVLQIGYDWTSFDEGTTVDRPVFWQSPTEPTGIPGDLTSRAGDTPQNGTWYFLVGGGFWFGIGIYSTDSCCGRGFLSINVNVLPPSYQIYLVTTLPADNADATGNTAFSAVGPDGNEYTPVNGQVYDAGYGGGGSTLGQITDYPTCSAYPPYVFYFKNNAYVLIDRPGTVVATGTPC